MKLIGLMHVRNERWVLGLSLPAALELVDEIIVLDHDSSDETPEIITSCAQRFPGRVHSIIWTGRHYNEIAIRQRLLEEGRSRAGTHYFMIDADEVVTGHSVELVRSAMAELTPGEGLELPWPAMWGSLERYRHDASVWSENFLVFGFADRDGVEYRPLRDGYDVHGQVPRGLEKRRARPIASEVDGGVMHLQFANRRRLLAKHVWYKMHDTVRFPGRETPEELESRYSQMIDETGLAVREAPREWWARYGSLRERVRLDDHPWHEDEILRLWEEHGPATFAGLRLFGLVERGQRGLGPDGEPFRARAG